MNSSRNYFKGLLAEYYIMKYMALLGYKVLYHRYKTPYGEIDIIAKQDNTLVFTEVKYRINQNIGLYAITPKQQYRIRQAALMYLQEFNYSMNQDLHFDVALVTRSSLYYYHNILIVDSDY